MLNIKDCVYAHATAANTTGCEMLFVLSLYSGNMVKQYKWNVGENAHLFTDRLDTGPIVCQMWGKNKKPPTLNAEPADPGGEQFRIGLMVQREATRITV